MVGTCPREADAPHNCRLITPAQPGGGPSPVCAGWRACACCTRLQRRQGEARTACVQPWQGKRAARGPGIARRDIKARKNWLKRLVCTGEDGKGRPLVSRRRDPSRCNLRSAAILAGQKLNDCLLGLMRGERRDLQHLRVAQRDIGRRVVPSRDQHQDGAAIEASAIPSRWFEHINSNSSQPRPVMDSASETIGDFADQSACSRCRRSLSGQERRSAPPAAARAPATPYLRAILAKIWIFCRKLLIFSNIK